MRDCERAFLRAVAGLGGWLAGWAHDRMRRRGLL